MCQGILSSGFLPNTTNSLVFEGNEVKEQQKRVEKEIRVEHREDVSIEKQG